MQKRLPIHKVACASLALFISSLPITYAMDLSNKSESNPPAGPSMNHACYTQERQKLKESEALEATHQQNPTLEFKNKSALKKLDLPFSQRPFDQKVEIAKLLGIQDLKSYGRVNHEFNIAMKVALRTHKAHIKASQLTEYNIVTLRDLGNLELKVDNFDDTAMKHIGQLTNLKSLNLKDHHLLPDNYKITDDRLKNITGLTNLKTLDLRGAQVTSVGLESLGSLKKIRNLSITPLQITKAVLQSLEAFIKLEDLWIESSEITAITNWQSLQKLNNFKKITISGLSITDEVLQNIASLASLEYLSIIETQVTDNGLQKLEILTNLKGLTIMSSDKITSNGVQNLVPKLTNLNFLNLCRNGSMKNLSLYNTKIPITFKDSINISRKDKTILKVFYL
jgi:hypothetical protein